MSRIYNLTAKRIFVYKNNGSFIPDDLTEEERNNPEFQCAEFVKCLTLEPSGYYAVETVPVPGDDPLSMKVNYKYNPIPPKEDVLANLKYTDYDDGEDRTLFVVDREEAIRRKLTGEDTSNLRVPAWIAEVDDDEDIDGSDGLITIWLEKV